MLFLYVLLWNSTEQCWRCWWMVLSSACASALQELLSSLCRREAAEQRDRVKPKNIPSSSSPSSLNAHEEACRLRRPMVWRFRCRSLLAGPSLLLEAPSVAGKRCVGSQLRPGAPTSITTGHSGQRGSPSTPWLGFPKPKQPSVVEAISQSLNAQKQRL